MKNCSWWVYTLFLNYGTLVPSVSAKIKFDQNNEERRKKKKKKPIMYDGNGTTTILAICTLIIAIDYSQRLCLM